MSEAENDNTSSNAKQLAKRVSPTPPPARGVRRTPDEIIPPTSTDAFALPAEEEASEKQQSQVLPGPEPAIFGGVNPPAITGVPTTTPAEDVPRQQAENPEASDEEGAPARLLPANFGEVRRIARSIPVLVTMMVVCPVFLTWLTSSLVPEESYAQISIELRNYTSLTEQEAQDLRGELQRALASSQAQASVKAGKKAELTRIDDDGTMWLKIQSDHPAEEKSRLGEIGRALVQTQPMQKRAREWQTRVDALENHQLHLAELEAQLNDARKDEANRDVEFENDQLQRIDRAQKDLSEAHRSVDHWVVVGKVSEPEDRDNRATRYSMFYAIWIASIGGFGTAIAIVRYQSYSEARRRRRLRRTGARPAPATNPEQRTGPTEQA